MKREPWHPAPYDELADVSAMQALARGEANDQQQRRALKWIIESAAMTYDQSFTPGQADVTAFIEGRRSVGNQIVKLLKLDLAAMRQTTKDQRNA
jgi:hypothetical protein